MKNNRLKVVNYLLYLSFILLIGTGIVLFWKLPTGKEGGHGLSLLGWTRHEWGEFHFWVATVMVVLTVLHLALNWRWIVVIAAQRNRWRIIVGFGLGMLIILFFALYPVSHSNRPDDRQRNNSESHRFGQRNLDR
jgi:hypothetical protein